VKKKSPPYAILVAAVVGILGIVLLFKWKNGMDQTSDAKVAAATKTLQDEIDGLKADNANKVVVPTRTDERLVYYATQPVDAGAKISPAFFEKKLTPNDVLPDAYTDQSDIVGFYAIRPIEKGDPLTPRNIGKTLPYLSERLPAGMRALALPVFNADLNDTGGFVVDGDKVDLLFTVISTDGSRIISTESALQNVQVLYVPGPTTRDNETAGIVPTPAPGQPLAVTFQVTPEQAQALIYLSQVRNGRFSMILRGRNDHTEFHPKIFVVNDPDDIKKLQRASDRSVTRVEELQKEIEAQQAKEQAQGITNETPHPTPPSQ
jgi:Flp pilus assembly protein CpaB